MEKESIFLIFQEVVERLKNCMIFFIELETFNLMIYLKHNSEFLLAVCGSGSFIIKG